MFSCVVLCFCCVNVLVYVFVVVAYLGVPFVRYVFFLCVCVGLSCFFGLFFASCLWLCLYLVDYVCVCWLLVLCFVCVGIVLC